MENLPHVTLTTKCAAWEVPLLASYTDSVTQNLHPVSHGSSLPSRSAYRLVDCLRSSCTFLSPAIPVASLSATDEIALSAGSDFSAVVKLIRLVKCRQYCGL